MTEWSGLVVQATPRLLLRAFRLEDLPEYAALNAGPEVVRYPGGIPLTRAESDQMAEWAQGRHTRDGLGLLAVERRADGAFLGMCGLHQLHWYPDDIEIGWRLARQYFPAVVHSITADQWRSRGARPGCPCAADS